MSNTIQFYSVSQVQTVALVKAMEDGGAKVETVEGDPNSCKITGKTPLGEIDGEYSYHAQSGTLTVVITKKPWEVPMGTIESHLRTALAQAAAANPPAPAPVVETPVVVEPSYPTNLDVRGTEPVVPVDYPATPVNPVRTVPYITATPRVVTTPASSVVEPQA